jgi:hypothetical protein
MWQNTNTSEDLTPWGRVLLEKLIVAQIVRKFPTFYVAQRFITMFTGAHHCSLP